MSPRIAPGARRRFSMLALTGVVALGVGACGSDDDSGSTGTGSSGASTSGETSSVEGKKLGLMMDVLRNDKSFGQATLTGAQKAADEFGLELSVIDGLQGKPAEAQTALQNLTRDNDFIVNGGLATFQSMPKFAERESDKQFAVYSVPVPSSENLTSAYQDWYPLGYQAGAVAAASSKSGTIGFVGGGEIPPTIAGRQGFEDGAKATKPDIEVVGTITGDFNDPAPGRDAAEAQIAQGADVLFSFLDAAHLGAVDAAKEAGDVKLIGVIAPKCDESEGVEIGDAIARQDELVYGLIENMVSGSPEDLVYGIQDPDVAGFEFCEGEETPELEKIVTDVREQFTSGELSTPAP